MTPSGGGPTEGSGPTDADSDSKAGAAGTDSPADSPGDSPAGTPNRSGPPSIGPLAVEAALLLDVVADRLTSMRPAAESSSGQAGESPPDPTTAPPSAPPSASPTAPPTTHARSEPTLGPDGRCPECGSIPGASCTACPLCRFLAVLRGERPEATARLVDGALLIVRTLRSLLPEAEQATAASAGGRAGGAADHRPAGTPGSSARRPGGLEHIDIR